MIDRFVIEVRVNGKVIRYVCGEEFAKESGCLVE